MKLIYIHQYFNTPDMVGSTRSYEMAKRIVDAGHEVHMITSDRSGSGASSIWREEIVDGIYVHWLMVPYNNKMSFYKRIKAFFRFAFASGEKAVSLNGDLVFASSTPLTVAIPAVKAKKKLSVPLVFEVRDLWPDVPIELGVIRSPLLKWVSRRLEKYAYNNSEHIIALSPDMAKGVVSKGYPENKISVIPNSCDNELFRVPAESGDLFKDKYGIERSSPLVVYTGTLGLVNGVSFLAEIASHMRDISPSVKFMVVGDGVEFCKVKENAKRLGVLGDNFLIISSISKREVPQVLSAATVCASLVINNKVLWANSANKVFDALASARPIVINHGGWLKDCVERNRIGLVLNEEDSYIAAIQLSEYLLDKDEIDLASRNSYHLANGVFSRDELAKRLINILESFVIID